MKKAFVLQITEKDTVVTVHLTVAGEKPKTFRSLSCLEGVDTSDLRVLSTDYNKGGKHTTYSAADFVGRDCRRGFSI